MKCEYCGEIPPSYITIEKAKVCLKCAKEEYIRRLNELNKEFPECVRNGEKE